MSLYNILFGRNPYSKLLLSMLDLTESDIGRFRDAFVTEGKIAIYTRLGGGNRKCWCESEDEHLAGGCYQPNIKRLQEHPNYLYDEDDDYDCTYATFYFSFPEKYSEILEKMDIGKFDPDERWQNKLNEIKGMSGDEIKAKFPEIARVFARFPV